MGAQDWVHRKSQQQSQQPSHEDRENPTVSIFFILLRISCGRELEKPNKKKKVETVGFPWSGEVSDRGVPTVWRSFRPWGSHGPYGFFLKKGHRIGSVKFI